MKALPIKVLNTAELALQIKWSMDMISLKLCIATHNLPINRTLRLPLGSIYIGGLFLVSKAFRDGDLAQVMTASTCQIFMERYWTPSLLA